ncbi:unnamed protein product, partial [Callosobruchus maculatus]
MDATILFQAAIPFSDGHLETSIGILFVYLSACMKVSSIAHDDYCTFMVSKQHLNSNGEVFSLLIIRSLKLLNTHL